MSAEVSQLTDPYNLTRFVEAQERVYDDVRRELSNGCKQSHWIWFVFPQISGLGRSPTAQRFSIASLKEAAAYLAHPLLSARLLECTQLTLDLEGKTAHEIFGDPDWMKFRSSMTLFDQASAGEASIFSQALRKYFEGEPDKSTLSLLARAGSG